MTRQDDNLWAHDTVSLAVASSATDANLSTTPEEDEGEEYLLLWLGDAPYLVRLADLREVLPRVPTHIALPFSPLWLWGIFPLRTDLVALVDPAPILRHGPEAAADATPVESRRVDAPQAMSQGDGRHALVIGEGERSLALVADRIGDILSLRPEDQGLPAPGEVAGAQSRYVQSAYLIAGVNRPALALRIAPLCEDILAALEERSAHE